jgi:hypothetical protein
MKTRRVTLGSASMDYSTSWTSTTSVGYWVMFTVATLVEIQSLQPYVMDWESMKKNELIIVVVFC